MKGGHAPIQIQRWAPYDYVNDPFVKKLYLERDHRTAAFYPAFLFHSFLEGGDLPMDSSELAAVVLMRPSDVAHAVEVCVKAGKLISKDGRLYHKRVAEEVAEELDYRARQSAEGKKGGRPKRKGYPKGTVSGNQTPPLPLPPPTPLPLPVQTSVATAPATRKPTGWVQEACSDWIDRFGGTAEYGKVGKALKPLVDQRTWAAVRPGWVRYLREENPDYASAARFADKPGKWLGIQSAATPTNPLAPMGQPTKGPWEE